MPHDRDVAGRDYLSPLKRLLDRVSWDVDRADALLYEARQELLLAGKTPYRAAAVVPAIFAQLDVEELGVRPNGNGRHQETAEERLVRIFTDEPA